MMRMGIVVGAFALVACGGVVELELEMGEGGSAGEPVAEGGAGGEELARADVIELGEGGEGGSEGMCAPKTLCRAKAGPCDTPELCSDDGACPDDDVLPYGTVAGSATEHPCGWFACDGESVACPATCENDDGCRPWPESPQKGLCEQGECVGPSQ